MDLSGGPFPPVEERESLLEEEPRENEDGSDDSDRRVRARISNMVEDEQQDSEMPHDPGNSNSETVIDAESGQAQQPNAGLTVENASNEPEIPAVTVGSVPASGHDGAPGSVNEPEEECVPLTTEQPVGSTSMNEFSPGVSMMEESHPMDQGSSSSSHYGPVRNTTLRDDMRHNLDLLDMGRLPRRNQPNETNVVSHDVLLHEHEVLVVEKRRGRKEIFAKELWPCHADKLKRAKQKEWNKLIASGAIKVLSKEESRRLRKNHESRKKILKSRYVFTKAEDIPLDENTELKARWCIRGYLDPDLLHLDTEAPTLSADGAAITLQLIASHQWPLQI